MNTKVFGFFRPKITFDDWQGDVQPLPPPDEITLPLSKPGQVIPFEPVVKVGDRVKTGQLVAILPNRTGLHSSVTGTVAAIGPGFFWTGDRVQTIKIVRDGDDEFENITPIKEFRTRSRDELVDVMASLGFASPWKPVSLQDQLSELERVPVHWVIIKAVDNEPPISVQRRFLSEFSHDFAESVEAVSKIASPAKVTVAVPEDMYGMAQTLLKDVDIFPVENDVLHTNLRLLVKNITGKFYPPRFNLRQHGIAVISAENCAFVGRCLHKGMPRIDKLVTVSAPQIESPVTVKVRMGTPAGHIFKHLDIKVDSGDRIVFGGILSGVAQPDLSASVTMGVNGLVLIPAEKVVSLTDIPCINCGRCVHVCPVNIQVNMVGRYAEFGFVDQAIKGGAEFCVECGLCAYVCPSHRPLLQYMKFVNREFLVQQGEKVMEEGD